MLKAGNPDTHTAMLAAPLQPAAVLESRDLAQYRPAKDIESFNALLPPPIEFVEGSSSGTFAVAEGKYQPINGSGSGTGRPHMNGDARKRSRSSVRSRSSSKSASKSSTTPKTTTDSNPNVNGSVPLPTPSTSPVRFIASSSLSL